MPLKKNRNNDKGLSFEHSLQRLEEIVQKLEDGTVPLDSAVKMYEEGVEISKECLQYLSHVETKLKKLSKDIQGNFELIDEPLEE